MTQFTVPEKIFQLIPETAPLQNHPAKNTEKSRDTPLLRRNTAGLHPSESPIPAPPKIQKLPNRNPEN